MLTGDIQTDNDEKRLARWGFSVRQITTGGACHLDARMIDRALDGWRLEDLDLLLVENVGNLVCPASYDLGEAAKVAVLSVTESEDKPLKVKLPVRSLLNAQAGKAPPKSFKSLPPGWQKRPGGKRLRGWRSRFIWGRLVKCLRFQRDGRCRHSDNV